MQHLKFSELMRAKKMRWNMNYKMFHISTRCRSYPKYIINPVISDWVREYMSSKSHLDRMLLIVNHLSHKWRQEFVQLKMELRWNETQSWVGELTFSSTIGSRLLAARGRTELFPSRRVIIISIGIQSNDETSARHETQVVERKQNKMHFSASEIISIQWNNSTNWEHTNSFFKKIGDVE